jgi:diguanylate cyclase (GGDEF)-like protein
MTITLNRDPGIVVSCLDYLTNIENILSDATIIEEGKSQYIVRTNLFDKLTNLFIRAVFDIILEKEFNLCKRSGISMAVLMIDIDDFKRVNDTYGHPQGDKVLSMIGNLTNHSVRSMDIASRYGGEEIAIIMPNTIKNTAIRIGERIRRKICNQDFDGCRVTVSIGISCYNDKCSSSSDLLSQADKALFRAKFSGKNKVVFYNNVIEDNIMKRDEKNV